MDPRSITKPLVVGGLGALLVSTALTGPPGVAQIATMQLAAGLAGVFASGFVAVSIASRLTRKHGEFTVYEIKVERNKKSIERIRVTLEFLRALGDTIGKSIAMQICGKGGCSLLIIVPRDSRVEALLSSLLSGLRVKKSIVNSLDDILSRKGDGEPIAKEMASALTLHSRETGETRGEILIGFDESNRPVYASLEEFWRHTGVFGTTGSGKTSTTAFIATQLARYVRVIVLDWHGEYESVLKRIGAEFVAMDPPQLPLVPEDLDIEVTVDVLEDAFDLTRHQSMLLYQALKSMIRREALPEDLEKFTDNLLATVEVQQAVPSRAELEIRAALERRLRALVTGEGRSLFKVRGHVELPRGAGLYIIRVNRILLLPLRRVYVRMLLAYLYYTAVAIGRMLDTIVVLEEAQNVASSDTRTIPSILAEARKRHLGLIIVSQSPSSLHPSILKTLISG